MAFGIKRDELNQWKQDVKNGQLSIITHYWLDPRFPNAHTVTKVGCSNLEKLINWGRKYQLKPEWIHHRDSFPHFDLLGDKQIEILKAEGYTHHIERFSLSNKND